MSGASDPEPSWDLYGTFLAVMETGSLSAASRALGIAQPTARRQIEALEQALGVVLFTRASNGLVPTDAAVATLPYAESMAATARALVRSVSASADDAGTVRVAASEVVGVEVLPPMLVELARAHPRIQIELSLSNRNEDLLRREADIAIRMVAPTQAALVARQVGAIEVGVFAHEDYLARRGTPNTLDDLIHGHALIGGDRAPSIKEALAAMGLATRARHYVLRTDSDVAQLSAIRAGLGIGACQVPLAARMPALRRVLPSVAVPLGTWVVMHEDLRTSGRVRRVFEHLVEQLGRYREAREASPRRARKRSPKAR